MLMYLPEKTHVGGDKPPGLRLILKMNNSTPDNSCDSMGPMVDEETSRMSTASSSHLTSVRDDILNSVNASSDRAHKKAKKKKKKKEKDRDKHEKKHKHHHKVSFFYPYASYSSSYWSTVSTLMNNIFEVGVYSFVQINL